MRRWKIECEAQRFHERGLGYRTRFGALKIKVKRQQTNKSMLGYMPANCPIDV